MFFGRAKFYEQGTSFFVGKKNVGGEKTYRRLYACNFIALSGEHYICPERD